MAIATAGAPDLAAIKKRQQATWASGDYHMIGTQILLAAEQLIESLDVHSTDRVLDVGGDHQGVGPDGAGQQRRREVLVDDRLDAVHVAVGLADDGYAAAPGSDDDVAGRDQGQEVVAKVLRGQRPATIVPGPDERREHVVTIGEPGVRSGRRDLLVEQRQEAIVVMPPAAGEQVRRRSGLEPGKVGRHGR